MDLTALQNATRSEHLHARREKAEKLYRLGLEYLNRAKKNNYERVLLRNASRCFNAAIENNRSDHRAYVQQAYLFLVANNPLKAVKYLQEATRLAPDDPAVKMLMEHTQKSASKGIKKKKGPSSSSFKPKNTVGNHPEQLARKKNELEAKLNLLMNKAYRELQDLQPTWAEPVMRGFQSLQADYSEAYNEICAGVDLLEGKLDITSMDEDLQKLEISLNRLDDVCELSGTMVDLKLRLERFMLSLSQKQQEIQRNPAKKQTLPSLLDRYSAQIDVLADELDELEGSGFNIQALMPTYENLVAIFQNLDQIAQGVS